MGQLSSASLGPAGNIYKYFTISGEKLEREEVDILIKECCDPEDDDGFIPYERKFLELE